MTTFSIYSELQTSEPLSPFTHVQYNFGMVLGVDDLRQEFAFHTGQNHWLTRAVIGYGTTNGLKLRVEEGIRDDVADIELIVEPGTAISPQGHFIRVPQAHCARLNAWIQANREAVMDEIGDAPSSNLTVYVVLAYRECLTTPVLIPGEPCRDESDATVKSRVEDDFHLELVFEPPEQIEVEALRLFATWIGSITWDSELSDDDAVREDFVNALLSFNDDITEDDRTLPTTIPAITAPLDATAAYLDLATRIWVTQIRPQWLGEQADASGLVPAEKRILLGVLTMPLVEETLSITAIGDVVLDESTRPIIASLPFAHHTTESLHQTTIEIIDALPTETPEPEPEPSPTVTIMSPVVASGQFDRLGNAAETTGELVAIALGPEDEPFPSFYYFTFDEWNDTDSFAVVGTPIAPITAPAHTFDRITLQNTRSVFEVLTNLVENLNERALEAIVNVLEVEDPRDTEAIVQALVDNPAGIMVRVLPAGDTLRDAGFEAGDGFGFDVVIHSVNIVEG